MPTPRPRALLQDKALVRAVARGRGGFPGEVRKCSGKRSGQSIRPLRGTSKGAYRAMLNVTERSIVASEIGLPITRAGERRSFRLSASDQTIATVFNVKRRLVERFS